MDATVHEIVEASTLPLSIIIVGVGQANFQNMEVLDADDVPLVSKTNGKKMARDIVQFVPFCKFKDSSIELLAEEVLREVPGQFVSYMRSKNINPPTPVRVGSFVGSQHNLLQQQQQQQQVMPPSTPVAMGNNGPFQQQQPPPIYPNAPQQQQGYPPQQQQPPMNYQPYPPQQQAYQPNNNMPPQQQGYPPQQQDPQQFSAQQSWKTAGHAVMFANSMTPPQQQQPQQQQGYPPQQPQQQGYPPQYPPQQGYPPQQPQQYNYNPNAAAPAQNPELYPNQYRI